MKRDPAQLINKHFDLLVIGGGISGACVAWDATLRGLSVALIEKDDFGHATSANSLKTIHGGLRYLQDADPALVRMMIHERMSLMRIAPHLVHPMPCLIPTYKKLMKSRGVMAAALVINDLMYFDRNQLHDPQKRLPRGRVISKEACLKILPGIANNDITGGAIWHDAQMHNSERMTLSFILSATEAGATVANYVEATKFLKEGDHIVGVRARDLLSGNELDVQARIVINAVGPWANQVLGQLDGSTQQRVPFSLAINLVTRQILPQYAVGLLSQPGENGHNQKKSQVLFVAPWRNYSLIGTKHVHYEGPPDKYQIEERKIQEFLDQINGAYPGAALKRDDVYFVHWGFLPAEDNNPDADKVNLLRRGQVHDHKKEDGIEGLITVVGVKYTSARNLAQKAVDLAFERLGQESPPCQTHVTSIHGGQIERFGDYVKQEMAKKAQDLSPEVVEHLIYNYGSEYETILKYIDNDPKWGQRVTGDANVIKAEVLHGVQNEMAQKLTDVIFRRTELGSAGHPGDACLQKCANIMATELGWNAVRLQEEFDTAKAILSTKT